MRQRRNGLGERLAVSARKKKEDEKRKKEEADKKEREVRSFGLLDGNIQGPSEPNTP